MENLPLLPDLEQAEVLTELTQVTNDEKYNLVELLKKTTLEERQQEFLEMEINNCDQVEQFRKIQQQVFLNIIEDKDRIAMGFPYSATDIKKTLNQLR